MRIKSLRLSTVTLAIIALFTLHASAQSDGAWVRLASLNGEVEMVVPTSGLVLQEKDKSDVSLDLKDAWFTVHVAKREDAKGYVNRMKFPNEEGSTVESRRIGSFPAKIRTIDLEKYFAASVYVASKTHYYFFSSSAQSKENPAVKRFLANLKVGGEYVFPNTTHDPGPLAQSETLKIEQLRMNQAVIDSFSKPDASPRSFQFGKVNPPSREFDAGYTRRLFLTGKPKPTYTDSARTANKEGRIYATVEFRADGTIGAVLVDPRLDRSLAVNVANVIAKIKFVPAEIDGKPITVTKHVHYEFDIY
jgi:hypothetical protein